MKGFLFACIVSTSLCFALEDTLPKGVLSFKTRFRILATEDYLNRDGNTIPAELDQQIADYTNNRAELEVAYGWARDITLIMRTDYLRRELDAAGGTFRNDGLSGVYLAMKQRLSKLGRDSRLMAETGVSLPVEADRDDPLPLESGDIDWTLIMSYNQDFFPTNGGFEMDFGYRFRNGDPENEWFFDTKLNLDLRQLAKLSLFYHVVESTDDRRVAYDQLTYPDDRGSQILGLDIERTITRRWRIGIGYEDMLRGRNQFKEAGWRMTLSWQG